MRAGAPDERGAPPGESDAGPRERSRWGSTFAALANPQYRWLFISNFSFFLGMHSQMLVRSMITFELTGSPLDLGLVNFAVAIPMMIGSPFGGVMADRLERRRLIQACQTALVVSELTILTLLATGQLAFWHLVCAAVVMGFIFPFMMPARTAIVVNVIGKRGLQNAMALSMGGVNATRILGPTLAGLLVPLVALSGAMTLGIALYVLAFFCLFGVKPAPPLSTAHDESVLRDLGDGFRYMGEDRVVLVVMIFGILPMFLAMPFQTLLVVFTEEVWDVGARGLGLLYAVGGAGGLVGSLYVAQLSERRGRLRPMMTALLAFSLFLIAFAMSPWFLLALPLVLVANVFSSIFGTLNNTAIQVLIPDRVRGRISSFLMMSFGVTPLGTLPMSAIAERYGAPTAVISAALLVMAVTVVFFGLSANLRRIDEHVRKALRAELAASPLQ